MIEQKIHNQWSMREVGDHDFLPASVPGSVYNDLLLNKKMENPYYRDNELTALKLMEKDYEYQTVFDCEQEILKCKKVLLQFEGLDTIADIYFNNKHLGYADNMHRVWEYDVKEQLHEKENRLRIIFHSPTQYIQEENKKDYWPHIHESMAGTTHIRKSQCMFGWDWGPRLPDAGIFRSVKLLGIEYARIDSVYVAQTHKNNCVTLDLDVEIECVGHTCIQQFERKSDETYLQKCDFSYQVTIIDPDGEVIFDKKNENSFVISNPKLWWPRGMGEQPLYQVEVKLFKRNELCDEFKRRIGLRTLVLRREKDQYGESFAHEINGVSFFAMGADYIPEDCILSRVTEGRTRNLLMQAVEANFNCIRVWGGGYYPDDYFWNICDELGLVVWMDFAFACAVYMLPKDFEKNITIEFVQNIKRIRNHACLGLWCGNNEIEGFMCKDSLFAVEERYRADYIKLYEYIIPKVLEEYDPQTSYWPSSPSGGGAFTNTESADYGDVHYWDVWHGNKPFAEYRKHYFRYLSEFGFQSFPSIRTVETFTLPEDRNIFSYVMEKHQRNSAANGKIMNYMEQTYLYPTDFDTLIYASQLLQADAIRYGVEHFRRNRGRCMGTIIWQLNDCWPVASWASIDYYGRWKALHYYAKRFFAPLLISCQEESVLTQDMNPNSEPYELKKSIKLCVTNDSMLDEEVTVSWFLRNSNSDIVRCDEQVIKVDALSCKWFQEIELQEADEYNQYVNFEMRKQGILVGNGNVLFTVPKFFHFKDPGLCTRVENDEIVVSSKAYARSVEIRNESDDLILSDNFFDMNAGEYRIKVMKGEPSCLEARSVFDIH